MKIIEAGSTGEGYFFDCRLDRATLGDDREHLVRKRFTEEFPGQGTKLMLDGNGTVAGRLHYAPIGLSPLNSKYILYISISMNTSGILRAYAML